MDATLREIREYYISAHDGEVIHGTKELPVRGCWQCSMLYLLARLAKAEAVCAAATTIICTHKPQDTAGPIGMYHCPRCGEMQVAGLPHLRDHEGVAVALTAWQEARDG